MFSSVYYSRHSNTIHNWEYVNGEKVYTKETPPLYFFIECPNETGYKSIYGKNLKKCEYDTYSKFKEAKEMYKSAGKRLYESDIAVENRFIIDRWAGKQLNKPLLDIHYIDIEVHSEKGFPSAEEAEHPVTIITIYSTKHKKFIIFAEKEFDRNFVDAKGEKVLNDDDKVFIIKDEAELLKAFVAFIKKNCPDIISGWNTNFFDIPYLINRCKKLLGDHITKMLSPIGIIEERTSKGKFGNDQKSYVIAGINSIDYLDLYRKYSPGEMSSFKLGYVAEHEIGDTKLEYEGTIKDLYKNWQKYCEYNIQDVKLLVKLDKKLAFMDIMINICYNCLVPLEQFSKTTKVLDGAFISRLCLDKLITPDAESMDDEAQYEGAFVKDPICGVHDWVVSFDATSLYPSIMMMHNISPETKKYAVGNKCSDIIQRILAEEKVEEWEKDLECSDELTCGDLANIIKKNNYSISSNGAIYDHSVPGIVSKFVKEWFDLRQKHKKDQFSCHKSGDDEGEKRNKSAQTNYKILINSVYGYVGSKFSRFYDQDNALAVTLTGQDVIKTAMNSIDNFFQNKWADSEIGKRLNVINASNIVCYGDTDSLYLNVGKILKSMNYKFQDIQKTASFIDDKICPILQKIINTSEEKLTKTRMNCPENKITFKREMVTARMAFVAKKRYVAWVILGEDGPVEPGSDHEIEIKGLEAVRSSTPDIVREKIKEFYDIFIKSLDKKTVDSFVRKTYEEFMGVDPELIAKISSANNLDKWTDKVTGKSIQGTPQHVKGAILYNMLLKNMNLDTYEPIFEGDKVHVVYINGIGACKSCDDNALSFKSKIPKEFAVSIDYDTIIQKVFIEPLRAFYELQKWQMQSFDTENIEDLFN